MSEITGIATKEMIAAMKAAERIYFFASEEEQTLTMQITSEISQRGCTAKIEQSFTFPGFWTDYKRAWHSDANHDDRDWFHTAHFHKHEDGTWTALYTVIKPEDEIWFTVIVNNDCENFRKAGFNRDMLQISIRRKNKTFIDNWTLIEEVCLDNTARPVQKHTRRLAA